MRVLVDMFTHLPLDSSVMIDAVTVSARARLEGTVTAPEVAPAFWLTGSLKWDDRLVSATWADVTGGLYANNPFTGQPWTVDEVNALAIGVRKSYATHRVRVTQVWATVTCH